MSGARSTPAGLRAVAGESFTVSEAVGGWRGILESSLPTVVFVAVLVVRPHDLVPALAASLAVSAVAMVVRLCSHQKLTQVAGGAVLALVSALWAWRSGQASNFYATGLLINALWLSVCLVSLVVRWPVVGAVVELWRAVSEEGAAPGPQEPPADEAVSGASRADRSWRTDPRRRKDRRAYTLGTVVLAAMFALRLVVEVPLYLAGDAGVSALGVARVVLGLPLFALTLWFVWLIARPRRIPGPSA